ncbi:MAG: hypothetical protein JXD23_04665 [Spirochaetales bacterium]|nr:hypothetical protein [Spirochaetales bacterium]
MKKSITCMCEHRFEADIPDKVDLEKSADSIASIIDGSFMTVSCPSCGKLLKPEFPFTLVHGGQGWEIRFVPELARQKTMRQPPIVKGKKTARVVIGYSELLEKVKIFEEQLDDRVIEYLKYFIMSKVMEKTEDEEKNVDVYYHERQGDVLEFHIQGLKSDEVGVFKLPMATYRKALADIDRHSSEEPFRDFLTPPYVSLNKFYSWDDG